MLDIKKTRCGEFFGEPLDRVPRNETVHRTVSFSPPDLMVGKKISLSAESDLGRCPETPQVF